MMPLVSRTGWLRTQRLRATGKQRVGAPPGTSGHLDLGQFVAWYGLKVNHEFGEQLSWFAWD